MGPLVRRIADRLSPWTTHEVLLAAGRIVAGAYALGSFACHASLSWRALDAAVGYNALGGADQRRLRIGLLAALVGALTYIVVAMVRGARRDARDPARELVQASYFPFLFAPLALWPLYEAHVALQARLFAVAAIASLAGYAFHLFATRSRRAGVLDALDARITDRAGAFVALAMGLTNSVFMARASLGNVGILWSGWDLAIYTQVHWNITTTGIPWSTAYTDQTFNHYAIHFSPIYHLTSLIYLLHRAPSTLLVIENVAFGAGALPVFLLVKRFSERATVALVFSAIYLLHPASYGFGLHEFHEIVLFVPLMLGLLWATYAERPRAFWILLALVLSVREDTAAYVVVFGVYLWLSGKKALAYKVVGIAGAYFVLVNAVVMPVLRGGAPYVFNDRYAGLVRAGEAGKASVVETLATNVSYVLNYVAGDDARWMFVALLVMPLAFLPLRSGRALVLLAPGLAFSLLSSFYAQYSIKFHYTAPIFPFLFFSSAVALSRWKGSRYALTMAVTALTACALLGAKFEVSPLLNAPTLRREHGERAAIYGNTAPLIHAAAASIPRDACVRATANLLVPVCQRREAYIVPWGKHCDWAFIDYGDDARQEPSTTPEERKYLLERLRSREFGVVYGDDRVLLIGRGKPADRNEEYVRRIEALIAATGGSDVPVP